MPPRRWAGPLLALAVLALLLSRLTELSTLARTLRQADPRGLLLAAGLHALFFLCYALLYQVCLAAVGVQRRLPELVRLWFVSLLVGVTLPGAGPAVFVADAGGRGDGAAKAAVGVALVRIADLTTFLLVLAVGLFFLFRQHLLHAYHLAGALLLTGLVAGGILLLVLALRRPARLHRLLTGLQTRLNRLRVGRWLLRHRRGGVDWATRLSGEFHEAAGAICARPTGIKNALGLALLAHLLDLAALGVLLHAFGAMIGIGALVAGFSVGVLFWIVSLTPEGIGVVEGMMTLTFVALGVAAPAAAAATLSFRGLTLYLPLLIGLCFPELYRGGARTAQ